MTKSWTYALVVALLIASSSALPVPEDATPSASTSSEVKTPEGVANSLTQGTKSLVETKTNLLKGLTGANPSSSLQADASSNNEAVQRNERAGPTGYGGYSTSPSYGPNTAAETPNNFVNVFSQAAANTVNFGTQLLNSLVGVAANLLQGTVSTLLSLLNAKGQVVGAVVQSAPPVLASVTRTAGDVLAAKARIFGAVTQAASSFGRQLGTVFGDSFSGLFARMNAAAASADGESGSSTGAGQFSAGGALRNVLTALTRLGGGAGGTGRETSSESGSSNVALGGLGNFATSLINAKLNLLNGLLSPFTGGRPILNFGSRGSQAASSNSDYSPVASEPNFRISIAGTASPSSAASSSDSQTSNGPDSLLSQLRRSLTLLTGGDRLES